MRDIKLICGEINFNNYISDIRSRREIAIKRKNSTTSSYIMRYVESLKCIIYVKILTNDDVGIRAICDNIADLGMDYIQPSAREHCFYTGRADVGPDTATKLKDRVEVKYEKIPSSQKLQMEDGIVRILLGNIRHNAPIKREDINAILFIEPYDMDEVEMFEFCLSLAERINGCVLPYESPVFADLEAAGLATAEIGLSIIPQVKENEDQK